MGLTANLQKHWEDLSNMIMDSDQEKPKLQPDAFKPTQCHQLGICVCGVGPASSPNALLFHTRLVTLMKHFMLVKNKKDPKSEPRILLESRLLVFRLIMTPSREDAATINEDDSSLYFLIGHINLTTWHYSLLQLHFKHRTANEIVLQVMHPEGDDRTCCVRTSLQFFSEKVDFDSTWGVQFCRVIHNDNQLPKFEMNPDIVEIEAFAAFHPFWKGAAFEKEQVKRKNRRQPNKSGRGSGRGRPISSKAKAKAHPEPLPIQGERRAALRAAALAEIDENPGPNPTAFLVDSDDSDSGVDDVIDALAHSDSEQSGSEGSGTDRERDEDSDSVHTESLQSAFGVDNLEDVAGMAEISSHDAKADPSVAAASSDVVLEEAFVAPDIEGQPVKKPRVALGPRAVPESTEKITVDSYGEIRYSSKGHMRAVCFHHEPHGSCMRQRTCRSVVPGRGRPIGQLTAWLLAASDFATSKEHIKSGVASYDQRVEARAVFSTLDGSDFFSEQFEAERGEDEDDEPKHAL